MPVPASTKNLPRRANSSGAQIQSSPHHPSTHREAAWRVQKGYTLAVEYNMHATWKGWGEQYVYTNPCGQRPRPGGTEQKKGSTSPLAGRGALRQSVKVAYARGEENSCHSCFCSPNLNWRDAERGEDRVPEARVSAPRSLASGAQELFA